MIRLLCLANAFYHLKVVNYGIVCYCIELAYLDFKDKWQLLNLNSVN